MNILEVLTLIFIVLKLCGVITWNWFWVLSPATLPLFIAITFIVIGAIIHD